MYKSNKQKPTKRKARQLARRGKKGTAAVIREESVGDSDSEVHPLSLVKTVGPEYRVAAAYLGVNVGHYSDPRIIHETVEIIHPILSAQ